MEKSNQFVVTVKTNSGQDCKIDSVLKSFPGGEVNVNVGAELSLRWGGEGVLRIEVLARIVDAEGIMQLAMIKDAIDRKYPGKSVILDLPYVPYGRQDRVCNEGEAHSLKVFCNLLNSMKFDKVEIKDPHSDVTGALIDNVHIIEQHEVFIGNPSIDLNSYILIAPDVGASKKMEKLCKLVGHKDFVQGVKDRDFKTGDITGFDFYYGGNLTNKKLLIVDDICDGGGTFLGLINQIRESCYEPECIDLFVTHGIFSKGIDILIDGGIDHVYTTSSYNHGLMHENLTIIGD